MFHLFSLALKLNNSFILALIAEAYATHTVFRINRCAEGRLTRSETKNYL